MNIHFKIKNKHNKHKLTYQFVLLYEQRFQKAIQSSICFKIEKEMNEKKKDTKMNE